MNKLLMTIVATLAACAFAPAAFAQDAKRGEAKAAMCIGCHGIPGYQASFPEVHKVPMISGQNDKYIISALTAYKKGERKHPTMRGIATSLSEQDIADLAAYYHGNVPEDAKAPEQLASLPTGAAAELLKKGNCQACHGANLSKPIDASYPKLAGQHADYLYVALKEYQIDKNPQVGRGNAVMGAQARQFSHEELKELAQYIATLPSELRTVPQSRFR